MCTLTGTRIYHIRNPETGRSYCQCENNATWSLHPEKKIPPGRRPCKQCADLQARGKTKPNPPRPPSARDLAALAEDCERDMYGADYDHLKESGWLDRHG
jgi:hypothetical protein